jgi:hypothetical protein
MAEAKTALQYLNDLGMRVKSLDERINASQTRDDASAEKFSAAIDRLKGVADRELVLQYDRFARDRANEADAGRERARADSVRCEQHQHNYDQAFQPFNKRAPAPASDAHPGTYRRELFREAQRLLPSSSGLAGITAARIDSSAIVPFEQKLFEELRQEANAPSWENRPDTCDDPRALRVKTDASGLKSYEFHAKESFIKNMVAKVGASSGSLTRVTRRFCGVRRSIMFREDEGVRPWQLATCTGATSFDRASARE